MSFVAHATRSLFPKASPRPQRRRAHDSSRLSHLLALACALTPLGAVVHAYFTTV